MTTHPSPYSSPLTNSACSSAVISDHSSGMRWYHLPSSATPAQRSVCRDRCATSMARKFATHLQLMAASGRSGSHTPAAGSPRTARYDTARERCAAASSGKRRRLAARRERTFAACTSGCLVSVLRRYTAGWAPGGRESVAGVGRSSADQMPWAFWGGGASVDSVASTSKLMSVPLMAPLSSSSEP